MTFSRFAFISFVALVAFTSCRKDKLLTDSGVKLEFSRDTLAFDTVFTTLGSAVRSFVVYNRESKPIEINSLSIAGGEASPFRLNVDGVPGKVFTDVRIEAKDSIYIFAAVTIDPNISTNPFVIEDSVVFLINGNQQSVVLNAWGQNAYFHYGDSVTVNTTWPNDKPHVIIHSFCVDTLTTLTIQAGTRIYMHADSKFCVDGMLIANGTEQDSIVFQGDRLEPYFRDLPGNWGFIQFRKLSVDNVLTHVVIKDALYGVIVEEESQNSNPKLTMHKCVIKNMYYSGIRVATSSIEADNCLVYNCGEYCALMFYGGEYDFKHCTFVNYGSATLNHQNSSVVVSNFFVVNNVIYPAPIATNANFTNCIIYGGLENELSVDSVDNGLGFDYTFKNCLIRSDESLTDANHYIDIIQNQDPLFIHATDQTDNNGNVLAAADFHLDTGSPAIDSGFSAPGVSDDLDDNSRPAGSGYDIGCFEKQ